MVLTRPAAIVNPYHDHGHRHDRDTHPFAWTLDPPFGRSFSFSSDQLNPFGQPDCLFQFFSETKIPRGPLLRSFLGYEIFESLLDPIYPIGNVSCHTLNSTGRFKCHQTSTRGPTSLLDFEMLR